MSREKQDDWKRTQLRVPLNLYNRIVGYAEEKNISLNSAMIELIESKLDYLDEFSPESLNESGEIGDEILQHLKSIARLMDIKNFP